MHSEIHLKIPINSLSIPVETYFSPKRWQRYETSERWQLCQGKLKKHPGNSQSQITFVPGTTEEYKTQVFEEIDGSVIEKLS